MIGLIIKPVRGTKILREWLHLGQAATGIERMQQSFDGVRFLRVDSTTDRSFAEAAGVDSTPTFLLYRDGSRVATVGTASPTLLRRNLEDNFT